MYIHLSRRTRLAALTAVVIAGGAIWAMSAFAGASGVSPIKDKFQAVGKISMEAHTKENFEEVGSCTVTASGTLPESGYVISATTVTFTNCKAPNGKGTLSATAKGPWTFSTAWGTAATVKVSIPSEAITWTTSEVLDLGGCTWTSGEAFTTEQKGWANGVSENEHETEGAVLTKSESESLGGSILTGKMTKGEKPSKECENSSTVKVEVDGSRLTWEDLTKPKHAILVGN